MKRALYLAMALLFPACTMHEVPTTPVPDTVPATTKPLPPTTTAPAASATRVFDIDHPVTPPATIPRIDLSTMAATNLQVWADDLDLTKATQGWKVTGKNVSAEENPVTLKGKTFAHAIGTHANGLIVIDLKGAGKTFSATVGIDDDAEDTGSCGFTVIGDGKVLARTGTINRQDPVKTISVDITGMKQLVLQVDSGDDDSIDNDHSDWAMPLITLDPAHADAKIETVDATQAKLP